MALLLATASRSGNGKRYLAHEATCTQLSCLALLAHFLNEQVVARLQSAARAGHHGQCSPRHQTKL